MIHKNLSAPPKVLFTFFLFFLILSDHFAQTTNKAGSANCLLFNGTNSYVNLPLLTFLNNSTNYTYEAWINTSTGTGVMFTHWVNNCVPPAGTPIGFYVEIIAGEIYVSLTAGLSNATTNCNIQNNRWYHIACVFDGTQTGNSNRLKVYLNGEQKNINFVNAVPASSNNQAVISYIGARRNCANVLIGIFNGKIDETRLWNYSLTKKEIRDKMCQKLTGNEAGLTGYWRFDEGVGNTLFDNSSGGNNGTLTNAPAWQISGAAIGDTSIYFHRDSIAWTAWTGAVIGLTFPFGEDSLTAGDLSSPVLGVHIYGVDTIPNSYTGMNPVSCAYTDRYFGVFIVKDPANPLEVYTANYYYSGNPLVNAVNKNSLVLNKRNDNADPLWANANAVNNTIDKLTKTGENYRAEYILSTIITTSVTSTNINCNGLCTGSASVTALGGCAPYTYNWSPSGGTNSNATGLCAGTYTVTITDFVSTVGVDTITLLQPAALTVTATAFGSICSGGNNGSITAGGNGGTSPYTYLWSNSQTGTTATNLSAGNYTVIITDANGCTDTVSTFVSAFPPTVVSVSGNNTLCAGQSTTLTASGGIQYQWSNGSTATAINVNPAATTGYTVTATDVNGCTNAASVSVTVNPLPAATISGITTVCLGSAATLSASGGIQYQWNTGATTAAVTLNPTSSNSYSVIVTDANGCSNFSSFILSVSPVPNAGIFGTDTICAGDNVILIGSGGGNYFWNTSAVSSSISVNPLITTNYSVIVSVGGCSDTAAFTVNIYPSPSANAGTDVSIISGNTAMLTASGGGNYTWSTGETSASITVSPAVTTTYTVVVTDVNGCTAIDLVTVFVEIPCGEIFIPNAFSPNDDEENDVLYVRGNCFDDFYFSVFNRWGQRIFETESQSEGWDGSFNGTAERSAVFVYYLKATLNSGEEINRKGNVSLIK